MRVISADGRTGTAPMLRMASDFGRRDVQVGVWWDGTEQQSCDWITTEKLRPLGPVEEELLRCDCEDKATMPRLDGTLSMMRAASERIELRGAHHWPDVVSEALEACLRLWEQHGVAT